MSGEDSSDGGMGADVQDYVTVRIDGQLFGLAILQVEDVFTPDAITMVPLASKEIAGVLNLRGRIVTAIDLRCRLGLHCRADEDDGMAVGLEAHGESYGLIIDEVGEVLRLSQDSFEANPANLVPRWASVSSGIHRLENELLVILDVDRVLDINHTAAAA